MSNEDRLLPAGPLEGCIPAWLWFIYIESLLHRNKVSGWNIIISVKKKKIFFVVLLHLFPLLFCKINRKMVFFILPDRSWNGQPPHPKIEFLSLSPM